MTSRRSYREAFDEQATIDRLEAEVGRLLDPAVFAALQQVVMRRETLPFIDDLHA
jgi:HD-GYP domain-containing protein (c-di-GMP phosphodiesterase class II)